MNKQEIFNTVLFNLRKQGTASVDDNGSCVYRAADGKKCAAGCLFSDEAYDARMEGISIDADSLEFSQFHLVPQWMRNNAALISYLQSLHDSYLRLDGPLPWEQKMQEFASSNGLEYASPEA